MKLTKKIPNNKTTDNNIYTPRVQPLNDSISYHDMAFTLNKVPTEKEIEYIQVANNV